MSDRILIGHGSGGRLYRDLVHDVFLARFSNPAARSGSRTPPSCASADASPTGPESGPARTLSVPPTRPVPGWPSRTDSHVVRPLRYPGGDIGRLAVAGTVNDLATAAARPLALAAAFIIEEGLPLAELEWFTDSMAATAREAGVDIVTGDTKVVERGLADGLYITTTGVGEVVVEHEVSARAARCGDVLLLSGSVGDHSAAVLAARGEFSLQVDVRSDCAPLWSLTEAALSAGGEAVRFLRDATRGGLTTVLVRAGREQRPGHRRGRGGDPGDAAGASRLRAARLRSSNAGERGQDGPGRGSRARRRGPGGTAGTSSRAVRPRASASW